MDTIRISKVRTLTNGFAMFSMFFGAGNVIFPLMIGQTIGNHLLFALLGLMVTAVCIPFSGLFAITLYEGNYFKFFNRIGVVPGMIVILAILALIGPFGGIPRCITLSFSTLKVYMPQWKLIWFSFISCVVLFFCSWKRHRILDFLGLVLTPVLLVFLFIVISKALLFPHAELVGEISRSAAFFTGLKEGYNTMDLLAAFFFSSIICNRLKKEGPARNTLIKNALWSSLIGGSLLCLIYCGFSYSAHFYRDQLGNVPYDQLLGVLGQIILGNEAGLVVSMVVLLSCLTTAIALTVVCSEFLMEKIFQRKVAYEWCLVITLFGSLLVSTLEFTGIVKILAPVLQVCYPSLLILSFLNIIHKLWGVKPIKTPVFLAFIIVLLGFFLS